MEATNKPSPPAEKSYILQDAAGQPKKRFTGTHLAHVSTGEHRNLPRWLTLDLYAKADGTYVLHRIGYSVVYHRSKADEEGALPTGCDGGEKVTLTGLLAIVEDGEACPKCSPVPFADVEAIVEAGDGESSHVRLERNYYKVIEIPDVPDLVGELEFVPKNSRKGERVISRPGQELLLRASEFDVRIAASFDLVQDI